MFCCQKFFNQTCGNECFTCSAFPGVTMERCFCTSHLYLLRGNKHFLLIRDMTELCVYSDLFFLQVPLCGPSQCAPVQKVCVPNLALKILQKGKTHLPQNLLPLQKRGLSAFMQAVNGSYSRHLENINCSFLKK